MPLYEWGLGLNGLFGPFRPTVRGTLRPLLARFKRGQGGSPSAPKWPKTILGPKLAIKSVHGRWKPSEATRSAPSKDSPPAKGKISLSSMHPILKDQ
ncbi:hypothetical protein O181_015131 [Austropuccinia psidii MF-1]|uniref:Uncharacterized protein n=1 Tax=Austropuccinia psidii MF-1 TaxID=1389203 RepID=A0A9Q3C344_9BASI|nr:hypothetical protein [Austropuccinia psidii MF-1]